VNILILVLSYNASPYKELMEAQQTTFDSESINGIRTVYYHGGLHNEGAIDFSIKRSTPHSTWERVEFSITDEYYRMGGKFKKALQYVDDLDYDIIFRTNSSSYINKRLLKTVAETLPKERLYAGWTFIDSEDFGGLCVSGAGIFLSRDTAKILMNEIDPEKEIEEDVYIGRILRKHGIEAIDDKSRYDIPIIIPPDIPLDRYHYRMKTTANRLADIGNMRAIHKLITA